MYLPKFKQTKSKYTSGGEYRESITGRDYVGYYFTTSKGEVYSGNTMVRGQSMLLEKADQLGDREVVLEQTDYDFVKKDTTAFELRETSLLPTYQPERNDFLGYLTRYFARKKADGSIIEISQDTYRDLKNQSTKYHYPGYDTHYFTWYTSYPVEDIDTGSYIIQGSRSKNERQLAKAELMIPGISQLIDPTQLVG